MSKEQIPQQKYEQKEREPLKKIEAIFILAVGEVGNKMVIDAKINALSVVELSSNLPSLKKIYFVGGKSELPEHHSISEDAVNYFKNKIEQGGNNLEGVEIKVLDKSNNTVGNIEEIMEEVERKNIHNFAIESNGYHINRVRRILEERGIQAEVIGSEDIVRERSSHHDRFIEKRIRSPYWQKEKIKEKILIMLLRVDPDQSLIKKWREFKRRRL